MVYVKTLSMKGFIFAIKEIQLDFFSVFRLSFMSMFIVINTNVSISYLMAVVAACGILLSEECFYLRLSSSVRSIKEAYPARITTSQS